MSPGNIQHVSRPVLGFLGPGRLPSENPECLEKQDDTRTSDKRTRSQSDSNLPSRELKVVRDQRLTREWFSGGAGTYAGPGEGRKMRRKGEEREAALLAHTHSQNRRPVFWLLDAAQTPQAGVQPPELQTPKESKAQPIPNETQPGVVHLLLAWLTQIYTIPHTQPPRPLLILSSHPEAPCPPQPYLPSGSSSALPSLRRLHPCHSPRAISGLF